MVQDSILVCTQHYLKTTETSFALITSSVPLKNHLQCTKKKRSNLVAPETGKIMKEDGGIGFYATQETKPIPDISNRA
jgi:hypothetical protein